MCAGQSLVEVNYLESVMKAERAGKVNKIVPCHWNDSSLNCTMYVDLLTSHEMHTLLCFLKCLNTAFIGCLLKCVKTNS